MNNSIYKIILKVFLLLSMIYFGLIIINSFFGWYGYEKWKYRRSTIGDKKESVNRKVFIRDLQYFSNIKLENFQIYIEKGFKYGYFSEDDTRLIKESKFPFQVSFTESVGLNNINYYVVNKKKYDSIDGTTIFLKKEYLKDTIIVGIDKFTNKWDSIGYIKVWDKTKR